MNHRTELLDLRTALEVLRDTPGQLVETNVEVDPAAELSRRTSSAVRRSKISVR